MKAVLFEIASIFLCAVAQTLNIHVQYSWTNQVGVDCIKDRGKATLFVPGFIITLGACATRGTVFLCWYSSVMLIIYSKLKNEKKWKTTNHSRASCFIRSLMSSRLIAWRRLAVCSRNVAICITRDYIVRQTKNLACLLLFTTMNNHNLFHEIFKVVLRALFTFITSRPKHDQQNIK